jgi:N-acetylglucosaminyldiphosphoundecaprenol N-acetyl-beta-D-mannosaminyltransferase
LARALEPANGGCVQGPSSARAAADSNVELLSLPIASLTEQALLTHIGQGLKDGRGGWVVTVNLDVLLHFRRNPDARDAYLAADLRVADGMPLVWASRVQGSALPERVAGSTLSESLIALCARGGWPVLLLGGSPGAAERAAGLARSANPELSIEADSNAVFSSPPTADQVAKTAALIERTASKVVLVGLGSPKQELLIQQLRAAVPDAWFIGVGGTFRFLAAEIPRAPSLLQRSGFEWLHRLAQEPRRLGKRYIVDDLPLFFHLMIDSARKRIRR